MAFPTTPILDNFNTGASTALTARAGWGASLIGPSTLGYATDSTPTRADSAATANGNYWNTSSVDCEAYCTVSVFDNVNDTMGIAARITAVGTAWTAYVVSSDRATTTDFLISKFVANVETVLATGTATTVVPGDGMGISVIGNVVTGYWRSGLAGAWVQRVQFTDSSITGSGFVGGVRHFFGLANSFDDFGGGAPVVDVVSGPYRQSVPFTRGAGGGGRL